MRIRIWMCVTALFVCLPLLAQTTAGAAAQPAVVPNQTGKVDLAEGDSKIISGAGTARAAKPGDIVNEGDTLVTGKDGEVHLTMQDTGFIAVRASTRFQIVSYKADGDADDKVVLKLLAGGFRSVTGWIGKFNRTGYRVNTPVATIGVRGTDHEPRYIPEGSSEGEPGAYDKVYVGQTSIETAAGSTSISPNQAGFVPLKARERPRLLAGIPRFYVPSKYEGEIAKKHFEIQKMIEQRREERRKVIRQMRGNLQKARQDAKSQLDQSKANVQERQQAAQQRREDNVDKRKDIRSDAQDALQRRDELLQKRKAFEADLKSGKLTPEEIRARRKQLLDEANSLQSDAQGVLQKRDALKDDNKAAFKERMNAAKDDRQAAQEKFKDAKGKAQALEQERESAKAEISDMHKKEQERYKDELKAARQKAAAEAQGKTP
jgi:hypothetical protein